MEESERQKVAGDLYKVMFLFFGLVLSQAQAMVVVKRSSLVLSPGPAVSRSNSRGALQSDGQCRWTD